MQDVHLKIKLVTGKITEIEMYQVSTGASTR